MTIKSFYFSQVADLRIEGVGIHASYSVNLTISDENTSEGKKLLFLLPGKVTQRKPQVLAIFYSGAK